MRKGYLALIVCSFVSIHATSADAQEYRTYDEVVAALQNLAAAAPSVAQYVTMGTSVEGRQIPGIKITLSPGADHVGRPDILFVGGHHAREWISIEVPLRLAEYLVANEVGPGGLAERNEIWIFPIINPDGYIYSRLSERYWRRNRRPIPVFPDGVDLNRNYGFHFGGPGSSGVPGNDTYRGSAAFSEPETAGVQAFIESREAARNPITRLLSYHSYSQLILYPWGYTSAAAPDDALLSQIALDMQARIRAVRGRTYTAQAASDLYLASGDLDDWAYGEKGILAFTIELPPANTGQGLDGFVLPPSEIEPTFLENLPAALYLINLRRGRLMDFETGGTDFTPIRSTIPGMRFTTTAGQDWIYGDQRLPGYNVHSVDSPDGTNYATFGNFFAWLGPNQGLGRIDFTDHSEKTIGLSYSSLNATFLEGFDRTGALVQRASGPGNLNTNTLGRLSVSGPIAYAHVHDAGNFWLADNLFVTDALGDAAALLPGKAARELQQLETFRTGQTRRFTLFNRKTGADLKFIVQWPGSIVRLVITNPQNQVVADETSGQPPITVDVSAAAGGTWTVDVTAVDVNEDEPVALVVGLFDPNDIDDDGVPDVVDNCVANHNVNQLDSDGDGVGNACDNCADLVNPNQEDVFPRGPEGFGNRVGDACEPSAVDTTPPTIEPMPNLTVESTNAAGANVTYTPPATNDDRDGPGVATCDPESGSIFSLGTTTVTCFATDVAGNQSFITFEVTVRDTTPPIITALAASPAVLWPPNHRMVPITILSTATDAVDGEPACRVVAVVSNEPANGLGDGDTSPDWSILADLRIELRAERAGRGSGRVYTATIECADDFQNSSRRSVMIIVPHNR